MLTTDYEWVRIVDACAHRTKGLETTFFPCFYRWSCVCSFITLSQNTLLSRLRKESNIDMSNSHSSISLLKSQPYNKDLEPQFTDFFAMSRNMWPTILTSELFFRIFVRQHSHEINQSAWHSILGHPIHTWTTCLSTADNLFCWIIRSYWGLRLYTNHIRHSLLEVLWSCTCFWK